MVKTTAIAALSFTRVFPSLFGMLVQKLSETVSKKASLSWRPILKKTFLASSLHDEICTFKDLSRNEVSKVPFA